MMLDKEKTYETTPIRNTIQSDIIELGEWVKSVKEGLPKEKENNIQLRYIIHFHHFSIIGLETMCL